MAPADFAAMYPPADIPLPPNFVPEHPFDNGEMRIRDEMLAPFPRTPEAVQQHIADYYAMITHMDAWLGHVLSALDQDGYADNTLVLYMADHGLAVGQHGLMGKQNLYDHSVRVPLIMRGPGLPQGKTVDALTYLYDVFPTLCDLVGIDIPETVEGESLRPLMTGEKQRVRDTVYSAYKDYQRMVSDGRWKLIRYYRSQETGAGSERLQLFDLANDPWETRDFSEAAEHRPKVQRLASALETWQAKVSDPLAGTPVLPTG